MIIRKNMMFYSFDDFYKRGTMIKQSFESLSPKEKLIYKLYVYSNRCIMNEYLLDKIWEYLNEPMGSFYYVSYEMLSVYVSNKELIK